jgi:hypothetical protein
MRKFGFSFSWKRALGLSAAKGKLSRLIGIPLTKSGQQRKAGRILGDLVDTALIAGTRVGSSSALAQQPQTSASATESSGVGPRVIDPNQLVDYRHGAKILVQYIPSSNETTVYHDIPSYDEYKRLPFKPNVTVNGEIVEGKHVFGFHNSARFSSRRPTTSSPFVL